MKLRVWHRLQGMARPWFTAWPLFRRPLVLVLAVIVTCATERLSVMTGLREWVNASRMGLWIRLVPALADTIVLKACMLKKPRYT